MNERSLFTGLILASGQKSGDPVLPILEALSPFSVKTLESSLLLIRDRYIYSILIALNPDHVASISSDLDSLARSLMVDLAYDFGPHLLSSPSQEEFEAIILMQELSANSLFELYKAISQDAEVSGFESRSEPHYVVTRIRFRSAGEQVYELRRTLREIAKKNGTSLAISALSTEKIGNDLLLIDMDSTLINEEVIDVLAGIAGVGDQVAAITERAMAGELDFESSLRQRVRLLKGQSVTIFELARAQLTLTAGAEDLIRIAHAHDSKVGIVSGGFHDVIDGFLAPLNIDLVVANRFEVSEGKLTGELSGRIIDRQAKAEILREFSNGQSRTIAIGDGANDISMLADADIGIAFNAKPALSEVADCHIYMRDLGAIAPLVGYR